MTIVVARTKKMVQNQSNRCKVLFADVDGTLTSSLCLWLIHDGLNTHDRAAENWAAFKSGEITFLEWEAVDRGMWMDQSYAAAEEALTKGLRFNHGVEEGVQMLKEAGIRVILLSGGIDINNRNVATRLGVDAGFSNQLHSDEAGCISGVTSVVGFQKEYQKGTIIERYCEEHGLDPSAVAHVGDSENDITGFEAAGLGIAFNSTHEETRAAADIVVESGDFRDVARALIGQDGH